MKKYLSVLGLAFAMAGAQQTTEQRIEQLLVQMTPEEKAGQLSQLNSDWEDLTGPIVQKGKEDKVALIREGRLGSVLNVRSAAQTRMLQEHAMQSRLKIPLLFAQDVIHGFRTTFPVNLGQAASWDLALIERSERIAATEAAAYGIHWTFAPMIDISRDARWGRVMEGSGEDTFLGTEIAKARIRGFHGKGIGHTDALLTTAKHYAAYGAAVGGRDYNSVDMSLRELHQVYLPPFKAAAAMGVSTFMNAFNDLSGIPASAHPYLLREVLKKDWGFKGFVVSDWGSIGEMINHGYAANGKDAAQKALNAGTDMDMESRVYAQYLPELLKEGKISQKDLDDAVRRVLRMKFALGLFEDPYRFSDLSREKKYTNHKEHLEFSREFGSKSMVLLKNKGNLLPLSKELKNVALIGPFAKETVANHGFWSVPFKDDKDRIVSQYEGLKNALPKSTKLLYAKGAEVEGTDTSLFAEAVKAAEAADVVVLSLGEGHAMSGEAKSRSMLEFTGVQQQLLEAVHQTGKPIVLLINAGRPLVFNWASEHVDAIVYSWWLGTEAGNSIADVLLGKVNPSGKLPMSFPRSVGQVPVYYNHYNTGRPASSPTNRNYVSAYIDLDNGPAYPFGYGLSYTTFSYTPITLSATTLKGNTSLRVSVKVTNTGKTAGEEVVQLYIRDLVGRVVRPVRELKGFEKVHLNPSQTKEIVFTITPEMLSFYDDQLVWDWDAGEFEIMVGGDSTTQNKAKITWEK
ncbi:beta-glucosidase BglX [Planobacterium oryzisoli]|uniref:beta-glucosidase n=1 Tax=Planobacterium oryzisoli TaxID=2771435 RepID=A0A931EAY1_9FLAO|nr:beta-glucosidase BglX [Planobacterium oryzisoli]MBF5027653.1 beta-glucosidase BglX [Planobacterium oryzisoli]